jgi:hypothetical protein
MALTNTDKREIERIARKEIKDFLNSTTIRQYEDKIIDLIAKEIKRGKLTGDVNEIVTKIFREFYMLMWTKRSFWEPNLKNVR